MIKQFCDQCGDEILEPNALPMSARGFPRLTTTMGHLGVEVIVSQNGASNAGQYCKYCVLEALYRLDDRADQRAQS